jgi:hypothetical protein
MILDYIAIGITLFVLLSSLIANLYLWSKYKKIVVATAQLILDNEVLSEKINDLNTMSTKEFSEGFIKFLSESREAAFEYIENVQASIQDYLVATENNDQDAMISSRIALFSYLPETTEPKQEG